MSSILLTDSPHDKYELVELLGEGCVVDTTLSLLNQYYLPNIMCRSYGAVYKSVNKFNNDEVAIKILPAEEDMAKLEFEIEFLRRMRSPFIVSFIEGYKFEGELWVIFINQPCI